MSDCDLFGIPKEVADWCKSAPEIIILARDQADAIGLAVEIGRLDIVSLILAMFGLLTGFTALIGFWAIRREAIAKAKETITEVGPDYVRDYMASNAPSLLRVALMDAEVVSTIQAEVMRLGIRDASEADEVDTDADKKETE